MGGDWCIYGDTICNGSNLLQTKPNTIQMPVTSNEAYVTFSVKAILDQDRHLNVRLIVDEVRIPKLIHLIIIEILKFTTGGLCVRVMTSIFESSTMTMHQVTYI